MKQYIINEDELKELLNAYFTLDALECGGVDNWEWYGDSFQEYLKDRLEKGSYDNTYEGFQILIDNELASYEVYHDDYINFHKPS